MLKAADSDWGNERTDTEYCIEIANNENQELYSTRRG
jgi:hypothetical protein